jgi:hypothetical protein
LYAVLDAKRPHSSAHGSDVPSHHFTLSRLERLPAFGSDHFPILIELAFEPSRGEQQEGLDADADDHAWAEEKAAAENADEGDVHTPGR